MFLDVSLMYPDLYPECIPKFALINVGTYIPKVGTHWNIQMGYSQGIYILKDTLRDTVGYNTPEFGIHGNIVS